MYQHVVSDNGMSCSAARQPSTSVCWCANLIRITLSISCSSNRFKDLLFKKNNVIYLRYGNGWPPSISKESSVSECYKELGKGRVIWKRDSCTVRPILATSHWFEGLTLLPCLHAMKFVYRKVALTRFFIHEKVVYESSTS